MHLSSQHSKDHNTNDADGGNIKVNMHGIGSLLLLPCCLSKGHNESAMVECSTHFLLILFLRVWYVHLGVGLQIMDDISFHCVSIEPFHTVCKREKNHNSRNVPVKLAEKARNFCASHSLHKCSLSMWVHTPTHAPALTHTHTHAHINTCIHTYTCARAHTHTHSPKTCIVTQIYMDVHNNFKTRRANAEMIHNCHTYRICLQSSTNTINRCKYLGYFMPLYKRFIAQVSTFL